MLHSLSSLRNAVLATALLALAATPAFAQRSERGGYTDAEGRYHGGGPVDVNAGYNSSGSYYNGGYYPAYSFYPNGIPSYAMPYQSYYYTPASTTDNSATVQVRVPANAKLWFDDEPTNKPAPRAPSTRRSCRLVRPSNTPSAPNGKTTGRRWRRPRKSTFRQASRSPSISPSSKIADPFAYRPHANSPASTCGRCRAVRI